MYLNIVLLVTLVQIFLNSEVQSLECVFCIEGIDKGCKDDGNAQPRYDCESAQAQSYTVKSRAQYVLAGADQDDLEKFDRRLTSKIKFGKHVCFEDERKKGEKQMLYWRGCLGVENPDKIDQTSCFSDTDGDSFEETCYCTTDLCNSAAAGVVNYSSFAPTSCLLLLLLTLANLNH